jgi:ABC-type transporter Mla MlaB component
MAAPAGSTPVFTIRGPLVRPDVPGLCARLQTVLSENDSAVALCDVDGCVDADLVAIDALARLQLGARRIGGRLRLHEASSELHDLLAFVGLDEVVPRQELRVEPRGQSEQREELLGVEEERELDDPAV